MEKNPSGHNHSVVAINEYESKQFLARFGIPVIDEHLAVDVDDACAEAKRIGFPVVLKAAGRTLVHKTELGGVALYLRDEQDVRQEGRRLMQIPGCEGLLVQRMAPGHRELVCGMTRSPLFGPCVMFGLGGVLTEALDDAVFRLAPLSLDEAYHMVGEIQAQKMLGRVRGESAVNVDALAHILVQLSLIAHQHPEIREIDLNPLKILPDGQPVVVDALVVRSEGETNSSHRPIAKKEFTISAFFEPRRVAVVGATASTGKAGNDILRNILANDFPGELFFVNPRGGAILNRPVYTSISALPEEIDLAVLIVPAAATIPALRECAARGIRHIVLLAGGFAEVDERGAELQQELIDIIKENGLRVLGPNTSGHISTPAHFTSAFFPLGKIRPGKISYIAQTGNFATHTMKNILTSEYFGVARVIGLGNKIDIDESDALEYLAQDGETQAILMYLESIKRPQRFLQIAQEVTRRKPVVMLKSAASEAGRQAAVAHTAALAAEDRLVEGLLRQAGIVRIRDYTHLLLAGKALAMLPIPRGNRVSFLAPSGALLVALSDLSTRLGLEVAEVSIETQQALQSISPAYLRMRNPVDIWGAALVKGVEPGYREGMEAVLADPNIDAVIPVLMLSEDFSLPSFDFIIDLARKYPDKPILVTYSGEERLMRECRAVLEPAGIPTFMHLEQPFEALSILARCRQALRR